MVLEEIVIIVVVIPAIFTSFTTEIIGNNVQFYLDDDVIGEDDEMTKNKVIGI